MRKTILAAAFLLTTFAVGASAQQNTEKKDDEKTKTATADAWRDAMPQGETTDAPPVVAMDESRDNVETAESEAQTEKRILNLEQRLLEAVKTRDAASLNNLLADDFTVAGVSIPGTQTDKVRYIDWAQKKLELKSYTIAKTAVRVYPGAAIATTNYKRQAQVAGAPADGDFVVTDVWVKRGKRWQAVSHHISQVEKPS